MANALTIPQQIARMDRSRLCSYADLLSFYQGDQWPRATLSSGGGSDA